MAKISRRRAEPHDRGLKEYRSKRDFHRTPEPAGSQHTTPTGRLFVIQKHAATRLHYDFRLELDGVLKSWAVPKGPSLDPTEKHLAVEVEDHPVEYGGFEGIIPEGEYGGGTVLLWDRGVWEPVGDPAEGLRRGRLKFRLHGEKLRGGWTLVRMGGRAATEKRTNWLLLKERDSEARPLTKGDVRVEEPLSVVSRRTLERIAADRDRVWLDGNAVPLEPQRLPSPGGARPRPGSRARSQPRPALDLGALPGARAASLPASLSPQLATLVKQVPEGDEWLHEIKLDGYRLLARIDRGAVRLLTRHGLDWTPSFPGVASALGRLGLDQSILDGEVVVLLPDGTSDFQALQNTMGSTDPRLVYFVFDLPFCRGHDLRRTPLLDRKTLLEMLLEQGPADPRVRYSKHIAGHGLEAYRQACRYSLEGIISKRADSRYESRRSACWLKVKCVQRQEVVIGGWTEPGGSRAGFGALLCGTHDEEGRLVYCGKVGTGYTDESLRRILQKLEKRSQDRSPFQVNGPRGRRLHWVRPELVAEVELMGWTRDGMMRHPSFQGLREDKRPREVHREEPAAPASTPEPGRPAIDEQEALRVAATEGVTITHPERVLYPEQGVTKASLAAYYLTVEELVLPHVRERPLAVVRCPRGRAQKCFFQKHLGESVPDAVGSVTLREQGREQERAQLLVSDRAGLLALVQMGVLEIHPWGCRADRVEQPDVMVFDLDPGPDLPFAALLEAAVELRARLLELGLESFVKTSGGKGLHVQLPLRRRLDWEEHRDFSRAVAEELAAKRPQRYLTTMTRARRHGRIFIDYFRNGRGATSVAAYSTRARPGAPVSTPLRWDELPSLSSSAQYAVQSFGDRLAALAGEDPWSGYLELRQSVTARARRALGL